MLQKFRCAHCGKIGKRQAGDINRSKRIGAPLYCDMKCSGLGRRSRKTKAQKVEEKRLYDLAYRAKGGGDWYRAKRREWHRKHYEPKKAAIYRKARMAYHIEYCRRPEYKAKKRTYDRRLRASEYGAFAQAHMLLVDIEREVRNRITDYEIRVQNGTINKHLQRRRHYEQVTSNR
jgi:hypothetical protein